MRNRHNPGTLSAAGGPPGDTITMELLGRGEHVRASDGANILELASVLAGEPWSSRPASVHPALATAAQAVNDLLDDDHRRLLTPLAPWLPGTDSAGAAAWAAIAGICDQAARTAGRKPDPQAPPGADGNTVLGLPGQAGPRPGKGGRRHRTHRQDRRNITGAICSAQLSWAGSGSGPAAEALCQLLTDCTNECRRLAGEQPIDPRLPLADCPSRLQVQLRHTWEPGCDWMSTGYQPVAALTPSCLRRQAPRTGNAPPPGGLTAETACLRRSRPVSGAVAGMPAKCHGGVPG